MSHIFVIELLLTKVTINNEFLCDKRYSKLYNIYPVILTIIYSNLEAAKMLIIAFFDSSKHAQIVK